MNSNALPVRIIKKIIRPIWDICNDSISRKYLKRNIEKHDNYSNHIRVLFIVQMPELWDKQSKVFELMKSNRNFAPNLLIVPKFDLVNNSLCDYCDELSFFRLIDKNALLITEIDNIEELLDSQDYVFYQRQYDRYLPKCLQSKNVMKHSKICYIPYATPELKDTGLYNKLFYRNVYLGFLESEYACDILKVKFQYNVMHHFQKFLYVGYPPFEELLNQNNICKYKNVLWTPRWSYDPKIGGSHFFEYCENLNHFAKDNNSINYLIRPHPMMFDNFIKEHRMTEDDILKYKQHVISSNAHFDDNKKITDTFKYTDILISDRSSVIPLFFVTGKPIILCPVDSEYIEWFSLLLPGLYIANNWEELQNILMDLINGKDSLKEVRQSIITRHFMSNMNASNKIVEAIYSDYYEDL